MAYNAEKKNLTPWYVRKNSFIRGLGKKILPKPNYPYPPSKVKSSAPNSRVRWPISCKICDNMLVSFLPKYRHFCKTNADTHVIFMTVLKIIYYINSIFKYSCKCDFLFCAYRGVASAGGGGDRFAREPLPYCEWCTFSFLCRNADKPNFRIKVFLS